MAIYREDIANIELESGSIYRSFMNNTIGSGDQKANWFGVRLFRNGEPVSAETATVTGLFIAPDGVRYLISETSFPGSTRKSENEASVQLPGICYSKEGQFCLSIKLSGNGIEGTMRIVDGVVCETGETGAVVPTSTIPTTEEIIEAYEEAVAVMGGSVRFDAAQTLTNAQKKTARENIGADDAVTGFPAIDSIVMNRSIHFPNFSSGALYALDVSYDSTQDQYTATVLKAFSLVGYSMTDNLVRIGYNTSGLDYPMPASFSSETSMGYNFAFLCFDLSDTTTTTWKIVKYNTFVSNQNLVPICVLYRGQGYFYDDNLKTLFKTSITNVEFLDKENYRIIQTALYYSALCNATALIAGRADYTPSEYKMTFTGAILGPISDIGNFDQSIRHETVVLDWSQEAHPDYVRFVYYDLQSKQMVAYCYSDMTTDERFNQRLRKNLLALVCAVYQGTFVYTCGACTPGKWFVNGNDIYGGSSNTFTPDLFKTFKRVGVVGDSLSVGYMKNKETGVVTSRMLAYSWVKKCMADAGSVPWLNLGTSGQSVLTWCTSDTYGKVQAEATNNKCQAYIIGLGENDQSDSARGIPLGEPTDIVDDYTHVATTYYGGYARIIQILKHLNPDCKIFCLTNPRTGANRAAYNVAVRYIAGTYYTPADNVFLIDLANDEPSQFNGGTFLPVDSATITGGHYSAVGYTRIASIMEKAITKAMEANQTHFIDIAYIPYDTGEPTANTMTE